ncbi:unnamed protein product [Discosporangium mesarthrocarpum]
MARFAASLLLLSLFVAVAHGFMAPCTLRTNMRTGSVGGMHMLFGGGSAKKASTGINIKVRQKTGFKETIVTIPSQKNLRKSLMDNKIDIYPLQGKIYNCGGGGSCGTCAVDVMDGAKNLSPKGPGEKTLLKAKPESYRLSCCTMVKGDVTVMTKP